MHSWKNYLFACSGLFNLIDDPHLQISSQLDTCCFGGSGCKKTLVAWVTNRGFLLVHLALVIPLDSPKPLQILRPLVGINGAVGGCFVGGWGVCVFNQQRQVTDIAFGAPSVAIDEKTGLYRSETPPRNQWWKFLKKQLDAWHGPVFLEDYFVWFLIYV